MMRNKKKPLVSIIISNLNGREWLDQCLKSLRYQTFDNFEIIMVDNVSKDDSVAFVKKNYPEVRVIENKQDLGFSGGNNVGVQYAHGEYVLLLNNDTRVTKDYLKNFIKAFQEIPRLGAAQSKMILMKDPNKLDACGAYWTDTTFLYHIGYLQDQNLKKFNVPFPVFTNKGASMLIRKDLINKIGLFDDDFWCYYEETDFCHRVWMAGYECWYYPKAVMYHAMGGTTLRFKNDYIQFHNFKNKLLSFLKNFELKSLIYIIPTFLVLNIILSFLWLFQGKIKHFLALYKAIWWNLTHLKTTLKKRQKIQSFRICSDKEIFIKTRVNPRLSYYYYLFIGLDKYKE
ncbi:MAG: hypothetical protein KatS3mg089_0403 [Patescibacteria group bacterium]|nr:MAG: hypothetical protein KatS3mg089_0403 [Patescibacteria group bacterium]